MKIPWIARGRPPRDGQEIVITATRFKLKSGLRAPAFVGYSLLAWLQVLRAPGVLGVSLRSQLPRRTFWTLSAWASEDELRAFVAASPHRTIMRRVGPWAGEAAVEVWTVPADALGSPGLMAPGLWARAQARLTPAPQGRS